MKRVSFIALILLLTAAICGLIVSQRRLAEARHVLATIPLCDDGRKQTILSTAGPVYRASFLDDSTLVYINGEDLHLWRYKSGGPTKVFKGHTNTIQDYEISPGRKQIATSSEDGTIRLWDISSGGCLAVSEPLDTLDQPCWTMLHDIVFHPSGKRIMSADMWGTKVWRTRDLKLISSEESDIFYLCCGLLSPDWKTVCSPIIPPAAIEGFRVYDDGECLMEHFSDDCPWCYSPDGKRLLTIKEDGTMYIWDVTPRILHKYRSRALMNGPKIHVTAAAFSKDGGQLVSAHTDGTIRVWNARNGAQREVLHWEGHSIDCICFSPSGASIAAVSNDSGRLCIWGAFEWVL